MDDVGKKTGIVRNSIKMRIMKACTVEFYLGINRNTQKMKIDLMSSFV